VPDDNTRIADAPLSGRAALITGASRGIGLAIARRLGKLGSRVAICGRHADSLKSASQHLASQGVHPLALLADVTKPADIAAFVQKAESELGPTNILVNNAGLGIFGPFHERSEADWDTVLDTNLKSVFLMSQAVVPGMIQRRSGYIVNISSLAGKNAFVGGGLYCASKWGLMGLNHCMAEELRVHGIRVCVICPGSVATEFSPHTGRNPATMLQAEDVAHAVASIVTEGPQSFMSEINLRPLQK
jgi:3-oxoacyl-[acyl-carrier protein] reductase